MHLGYNQRTFKKKLWKHVINVLKNGVICAYVIMYTYVRYTNIILINIALWMKFYSNCVNNYLVSFVYYYAYLNYYYVGEMH